MLSVITTSAPTTKRSSRARPRRSEPRGRLGERERGAVDEAAARHAELPGEGGQREDRADAAAAVLVALEPVAAADRRGRERVVLLGEPAHDTHRDAADARGLLRRPPPRQRHELLEARHV